jgi:hypothetical protein
MKNEQEKSDPSIVAKRPANKPDIARLTSGVAGRNRRSQGKGRGKHGRATHVPDTEPGKRVPGA